MNLPFNLLPPLHIFPAWTKTVITLFVLLFCLMTAIVAGFLLYHFYLKSKQTKTGFALNVKSLKDPVTYIRQIKQTYTEDSKRKEGLFLISARMRTYFEDTTKMPVEEMTAVEFSNLIKDTRSSWLTDVTRVQFSRTTPSKENFTQLCNRAINILEKKL
jgi:uncharacterized membrane protein YraQ (UPF0718 family)